MSEYKATAADNKKRLDIFLTEKIPDISRSQLKKKIKAGDVLVNGEKTSVHHFLDDKDTITLAKSTKKPKENIFQKLFKPKVKLPDIEIIDDQPSYLIINKPAGLIVHEAPGNDEPTLVDIIIKKYPAIKKIGEDPMRPGIVHRLDKEVSGLIVIAKTQDMFDHLKNQFKSRKVRKEYITLVHGAPKLPYGEINFNIDRSETIDYKMAAVPEHEDRGRKAVTEFEVIESKVNYSLLNIKPKTGRTHQIRVHLNAYGLPIVGDLIYKPKKLKNKIKMHRIFLHATYLGFNDLNNKWREYQSPLPAELEKILKDLKQ